MKKLTFPTLLIFALCACEEGVKFEEPQPVGKSNLRSIPKNLRGTYQSKSDDTFLTIDDRRMIEWMDFESRTVLDSLDLEIDSAMMDRPNLDSLLISQGQFRIQLSFLPSDSVIVHYTLRDTIFELSEKQLLRKYKNQYFLNYQRSVNNWKVRKLALNGEMLTFYKVRVPEDITDLQEITEVEEIRTDSGKFVGYKLNPTRKELKELMKHSFSETATYQKLK